MVVPVLAPKLTMQAPVLPGGHVRIVSVRGLVLGLEAFVQVLVWIFAAIIPIVVVRESGC